MPNLRKSLIFISVSALATLTPLLLGRWLWPAGLDPGAIFIFWPASGVNLALALILGRRFIPLILLNGVLAIGLLGEPVGFSLIGAVANSVETLLACWVASRFGRIGASGRSLGTVRGVVTLAATSLTIPLFTSACLTGLLVANGTYPPVASVLAFVGLAVSNACGMAILAPAVLAISQGGWHFHGRRLEAAFFTVATIAAGWFGFEALFHNQPNAVFLVFVTVIFAALRFGWREVALLNLLTLAMIYAAMIANSGLLPRAETSQVLWFVQGFVWVLAATSLLIASQVADRTRAEQRLVAERTAGLELQLSEKRAQLDSLRHQINPHFLFNSLNSIYAALPSDGSAPRNMLTRLAGYLRSTLDTPAADVLPLVHEIRNAERYLAIEADRFGDALQIDIKISPAVRAFPIPVHVVQLLVENAIRHGLEATTEDFQLAIHARLAADGGCVLDVANTGEWKEPAETAGYGLANIHSRLHLLYGDRASLERILTPPQVIMRLRLPVVEEMKTSPQS